MFNDVMIEETETDTSESYSEHSVVNSSRSRFETSEDFSLPILGIKYMINLIPILGIKLMLNENQLSVIEI